MIERSDVLADDAVEMFDGGSSTAEAASWLESQVDVVSVESDDLAIRFRVQDGRATWILRSGALATRGAPGADRIGSARAVAPSHVVGDDSADKQALVLSPMQWDFGSTDDGSLVATKLGETRGYEGGVTFAANARATDVNVSVDSFKGWRRFDVVHVVSHGTRVCFATRCRAVIAASMVRGTVSDKAGTITLAEARRAVKDFAAQQTDPGVELAKGQGDRSLEVEEASNMVLLTAEFFQHQYPGGLDNTLVFFNACESLGPQATDLADVIRGMSSVYFGWTEDVDTGVAFAAAGALYENLADLGYPAGLALDKIGTLAVDTVLGAGARLRLSPRSDGDDLRIREIVDILRPEELAPLAPGDVVSIVGALADGEPDSVPYQIRVDGVIPELADRTMVQITVGGIGGVPQQVADGKPDGFDGWILTGSVALGYDVTAATEVEIRAWVDLADGGQSEDLTSATLDGSRIPVADVGPGVGVEVCSLLADADVAAVFDGLPPTAASSSSEGTVAAYDYGGSSCRWQASVSQYLSVDVYPNEQGRLDEIAGYDPWDRWAVEPLAGVGDAARVLGWNGITELGVPPGSVGAIVVEFGDVGIRLELTDKYPSDPQALIAAARIILDQL